MRKKQKKKYSRWGTKMFSTILGARTVSLVFRVFWKGFAQTQEDLRLNEFFRLSVDWKHGKCALSNSLEKWQSSAAGDHPVLGLYVCGGYWKYAASRQSRICHTNIMTSHG